MPGGRGGGVPLNSVLADHGLVPPLWFVAHSFRQIQFAPAAGINVQRRDIPLVLHMPEERIGMQLAPRTGLANRGEIGRHFTIHEGIAMFGVSQIHLEMKPGSVLKDTHVPRS
jgi:hypothetical protein